MKIRAICCEVATSQKYPITSCASSMQMAHQCGQDPTHSKCTQSQTIIMYGTKEYLPRWKTFLALGCQHYKLLFSIKLDALPSQSLATSLYVDGQFLLHKLLAFTETLPNGTSQRTRSLHGYDSGGVSSSPTTGLVQHSVHLHTFPKATTTSPNPQ